MTAGLLSLLGYTGYGYFKNTGFGFEQGRYLLPLGPLYAAVVAGGLGSLGSRLGSFSGSVLAAGAFCWSAWGIVLTIARFYG